MAKNNNNNGRKDNDRKDNNKQQQAKNQAKEQARQAAASGNYSKSNTQALKAAGVNSNKIQTIKGTAQQTKQNNRNADAARNNPIYQGAGFQDAVQKQASQGTVGQAFFDSADFAGARGDLSNQQVADYAMSQGYGLGDQWQKDFGTNTTEAQSLKEAMKGDGKIKLKNLLRIGAGQGKGTDLVDNKEFRQIYKHFDGNKTGLKITSKMDKINAKQAEKDNGYNPMGVQAGTLGKISDGKYGDGRDLVWGRMANNTVGTAGLKDRKHGGALSQLAMNYPGSNLDGIDKNRAVYGADADGGAIFSPGQGGKSWADHKLNKPQTSTYQPWATDVQPPGTTGPEGTDGPTTNLPEETPGFGTGGMGDSGEKNALTFRQAKSRWKANGRAYKGTSGLKYSRAAGFGGFGASAATF